MIIEVDWNTSETYLVKPSTTTDTAMYHSFKSVYLIHTTKKEKEKKEKKGAIMVW